jgi:hypothetical protein
VTLRPHGRKQNQGIMNRQERTSISGKPAPENAMGEGKARLLPRFRNNPARGEGKRARRPAFANNASGEANPRGVTCDCPRVKPGSSDAVSRPVGGRFAHAASDVSIRAGHSRACRL